MQQNRGRRASSHRAQPASAARGAKPASPAQGTQAGGSGVLVYLLVLAGVAAGLLLALHGSRDAGRGAGLIGCVLLAAALARLALPPRYAALLASRGKTLDVLAFAILGGGVLGLALWLP